MKRLYKKSRFVIKNGKGGKARYRISLYALAVIALVGGGLGGSRVFAEGAIIGGDSSYGDSGSEGGGSGSGCDSDKVGKDGGLDCMGVSWIYYQATGNAGSSGVDVWFSPRIHTVANPIPAECSLPGRGFWAYGVGGVGQWQNKYKGSGQYVFRPNVADSSYFVLGGEEVTAVNTYSTGQGKHGLQGTYPWAYKGSGNGAWSSRLYRTFADDSLNHHLYKNINGRYVEIYKATKYGVIEESASKFINAKSLNLNESNPEVWEDFKIAYKYLNNSDYPRQTFPNSLGYFCYWDDMQVQDVTLTGKSVNGAGSSLASVSGLEDKTSTVTHGASASVTRGTADGYTYRGWASTIDNAKNGTYATTGEKYSINSLTADTTVYARYDRNRFQGRALVFEGRSTSGTNLASTGWKDSNDSKTLNIDCPNDGCAATFDLYLRTVAGAGKTYYTVSRSKNNAGYEGIGTITPASPSAPAGGDNGTEIRKVDGSYVEDLNPGDIVCYRLSFRPYGTSGNTATAYVETCAKAAESTFEGKSSVTEGVNGTTDWKNTDKTEVVFIESCSALDGCVVRFNHRLKRTAGIGTTEYKISRTSNYTNGPGAIQNNNDVGHGVFNTSSDENGVEVSSSGPFTLYPGVVVCETLTFKPSNKPNTSNVATTICASALGDAQPPDPEQSVCTGPNCEVDPDCPGGNCSEEILNKGSDALVDIEVKNESVAKYNSYRRVVYGKPGDNLTYRASYNPRLQYTYHLIPQQMRIGSNTTIYPSNSINSSMSLGAMFNEYFDPDWKNKFYVRSIDFASNSFSQIYDENDDNHKNGDTTRREEENSHQVTVSEVGRSLNENAEINYPGGVNKAKTTPVQVKFTANGLNNLANVYIDNHNRTAYARIPYNYDTEIVLPGPDPIPDDEGDPGDSGNPDEPSEPENQDEPVPGSPSEPEIVYAGEDKTVEMEVSVLPKYNEVTEGNYATKTGSSTIKIVVYLANDPVPGISEWPGNRNSDLCEYYGTSNKEGDNWDCGNYTSVTRNLNSSGKSEGSVEELQGNFNVPDLKAGSKICMSAAIYPANSGLPTNTSPDGSGTWRISNSRCFVVAKRPNLQILGGGMFSAGKIEVQPAIKRNVFGVYPFSLNSKNNTTIFGPWTEQYLVSVGAVTGFATGASTGYFGTTSSAVPASGRTPVEGLGGSKEKEYIDFCIRSPLTIPNTLGSVPCKGRSNVGVLFGDRSNSTMPGDKDKIIAGLVENMKGDNVETVNSDGGYVLNGAEMPTLPTKVIHASEDITIDALTVPLGKTLIVHAGGNVNINGDVVYADGYASLSEIPKLIIYAEKNVNIGCEASRIDAVIIAGKNYNSGGVVNTCPTTFVRYNGDLVSEINWKYKMTTLINTQANSRQLKINGTIIANKLIANRTYGAARGVNSVVPAEIINYDTTLYGWGMFNSEKSGSSKLNITYQHELAPRY